MWGFAATPEPFFSFFLQNPYSASNKLRLCTESNPAKTLIAAFPNTSYISSNHRQEGEFCRYRQSPAAAPGYPAGPSDDMASPLITLPPLSSSGSNGSSTPGIMVPVTVQHSLNAGSMGRPHLSLPQPQPHPQPQPQLSRTTSHDTPQRPQPPPLDQMRAYRACLNCRNRKSKCDLDVNGGRPASGAFFEYMPRQMERFT